MGSELLTPLDKTEYNRERQRKYRAEHPEILKAQKARYWDKHKAERTESHRIWFKLNKDKASLCQRNYRQKLRADICQILGQTACVFCGYSIWQALQFDHKNGNGRREIKYFGSTKMMLLYYRNNPDEARKKLQVVCANCNFLKVHSRREHN